MDVGLGEYAAHPWSLRVRNVGVQRLGPELAGLEFGLTGAGLIGICAVGVRMFQSHALMLLPLTSH